MKCPKCSSTKQLTPESKRTEDCVWRRRICKICNHSWLTQECISTHKKMPTEVWQFVDKIRQSPKNKNRPAPVPKTFLTEYLKKLPW